ncbi:MAG TPA: hypothetical protein VGJ53_12880 [Micromonosporaceae bacterium]|jgi:hypothetical protein
MTHWTKPYDDPWRIVAVAIASIGGLVFCVAAGLMAASWQTVPPGAAAGLVAFAAVWLTFAWRFARTGLLISKVGIRMRWVHRTRTVGWDQVWGFQTARDVLV